jgi:hypothetical protein
MVPGPGHDPGTAGDDQGSSLVFQDLLGPDKEVGLFNPHLKPRQSRGSDALPIKGLVGIRLGHGIEIAGGKKGSGTFFPLLQLI